MAGYYTEITDIVAPSSAIAGESVPVTIKIRNKYSASVHVAAIGIYDTEERFIDWLDYWIPAGVTHSFSGSFVMPNKGVTIVAYSYYEDEEGYWHKDDEVTKGVSLAAPPEVYRGTIARLELEYDEARAAIPAYNIPQGQRGLVHIWGRNDMSTSQKLGIYWIVKDPDGITVEEYYDWQAFSTGPGDEHEFIGGRFNLDKVGTYDIQVGLLMNYDNPVYVDIYYGDLCTVAAAVPEPEFRGFGVTEYITV